MDASNIVLTLLGLGGVFTYLLICILANLQASNFLALAQFEGRKSFEFTVPLRLRIANYLTLLCGISLILAGLLS